MVIFARLSGLYFFPHQSCTSSTLLLRKEIYPRKSITNLYQLIFSCLLSLLPSAGFVNVPVGAGEVKLFLDIQFVQEVSRSAELVHHEEDVADIHADTSLKVRLEHHVA